MSKSVNQLSKPHWACEDPRKFVFKTDFASKTLKYRFGMSLQRPSADRTVDHLGRKSHQKKHYSWVADFIVVLFKNILFNMNGRQSNIRSLHNIHIWSTLGRCVFLLLIVKNWKNRDISIPKILKIIYASHSIPLFKQLFLSNSVKLCWKLRLIFERKKRRTEDLLKWANVWSKVGND